MAVGQEKTLRRNCLTNKQFDIGLAKTREFLEIRCPLLTPKSDFQRGSFINDPPPLAKSQPLANRGPSASRERLPDRRPLGFRMQE